MMRVHPDLDRLRAFADGEEADAARAGRTAAHLRDCADCRARVTAFRERREQLRAATTLAPPPGAWDRILARREAGEELLLPAGPIPIAVPEARTEAGRRGVILRRAAVLLVGVAGIASASVPGSPVREWLGAVLSGGAAAESADAPPPPAAVADSAEPAPAAAPAAPAEALPEAGIAVLPNAGEVRVVVQDAGPALRIRVRLTDAGRAEVRGRGAAAGAGFASGRGRITVTGAAAGGELEVVLPRGARRASLTVGGRRYVALQDGQMTVLVPADSNGAEIVFPARP